MMKATFFFLFAVLASCALAQVGICVMKGTSFNPNTAGTLTFTWDNNTQTTNITGTITGMAASSTHGIHIHVYGDISAIDGTAAGGHYNPMSAMHGDIANTARHVGDWGNVYSDSTGAISINVASNMVKLSGTQSAIGRTMIIHEKMDDGVTQPTGNSGTRYGQCVIGIQSTTGNVADNEVASYASCEMRGVTPDLYGRVIFTQNADGTVTVNSTICSSTGGSRGFHIHEFGDLSGADITTKTGGHYNPNSQMHGAPMNMARHVGDLGNVTILYGIGSKVQTVNLVSLNGPSSIIGRAVVIHANFDDGVSQPSGNSGVKVGACVIGTVDVLPLGGYSCNITTPPTNSSLPITFAWLLLVLVLLVHGGV
jgi:Cu-Zn family superoxide dismutase